MLSRASLTLVILSLLLAGCDRQSGEPAQPAATQSSEAASEASSSGLDRSHKGSPLPDLTFADQGGRKLTLSSLKGKPLLVNLWATWCAPCVAELPTLAKLSASGTIRVVAVSQDSGHPEKVAAFLKDKHLDGLEPWLDPKSDFTFALDAGTLPTTVLYDAQGKEVWRWTGGHDWSSPESAKLLAEAS